jgi:mRNA degradation ribonuclease J1/J2
MVNTTCLWVTQNSKALAFLSTIVLFSQRFRIEFNANGEARVLETKVESGYVFVDGLGVDVGEVVIRDRQLMAQDGMFVISLQSTLH